MIFNHERDIQKAGQIYPLSGLLFYPRFGFCFGFSFCRGCW